MVASLVKGVSGAYNAAHFERDARSRMNRMGDQAQTKGRELEIDRFRLQQEPYYAEVNGEITLFTIAAQSQTPVMLNGPTGCGKTRLLPHMTYRLTLTRSTAAC